MAIPGNMLSSTTESVDPNTSGWWSKTNCTLSLGTGGRNGDGTLKLTSVAAGEMQARTFSSYAVMPGRTYWTFADASASAQPERIGLRWLNSLGFEISITWSLTTLSASATWHRISVAGVAPSGAARVQVVLSSMTPAGAGVVHQFENVYLGLPKRLTGSMISFNAQQGAELDLTAWNAEANCTLSRSAPAVSWPATWYYAGGEVVALNVTANGNASALCIERPAVTPGEEYVAYAYLSPPTSGSTCWVELRFYDSGGAQIQAIRSTLAAPGTGNYRQIASGIAPSTAASASVAVGIVSGTAGQILRFEGVNVSLADVFAESAQRTGNILPMADWDFEQGVGSWTVVSGAATLARSTPWGGQAFYDAYSLTVASATATSSVIRSDKYPIGANGGEGFRLEFYGKTIAGGWSVALRGVRWYDAANVDLGYSSNGPISAPAPGGGWWTLLSDFTAPATATQAAVELQLTATAVSSTLQIDRPALWQAEPLLEAVADDATASVRITLRELEIGDLLTVYRVTEDGARALVRGPDGLLDQTPIVADSMVIEDYEIPLGVPVTYRVETVNSDGLTGLAYRSTAPITITVDDPNYAWLRDPLLPQLNMRVMVRQAPEWTLPIERSVARVRGRPNPVVRADVRGGREGTLAVWTETDNQREALRALLASGDVLLWQPPPGMGETDTYVAVGEVSYQRTGGLASEPLRQWTLPLTEVDMPTGGLAGSATRTWQDVLVENATWQDVLNRYATWLDLLLDNPIA